ncbi:putative manganese superoxide dismutase precursor (sod-2) [Fusarium proliferatum ET1]|uniref:Superoxide dismutase n=3 Tax=Fusarium fujikuroi species complex TaxID=171627 RepID=A0A8H5Z2V8_9HYPO|nr:putative manganese superoxide dismutase precursor (sod-2) [Fusarium proliferatum ET1]KAF5721825.1 superoxide dismutase Fe-Mn family [Fusarium globosum]RBA13721.1 Fe-Mn family superoxide dismutase [Fusarium proliferatum]RKL41314.1 Superoxide dismutase [Mn] [Fusarium proliferatum]CZR46257.1 probable manganese superoxide dismutase precursor (sod-2) [Fusarium proliferatum ET1]
MFFSRIPLLPLFFFVSTSSSSSEPDLASDHNQAYTALPDNIQSFSAMSVGTYSLPALPYAYDALEPSISAQIMELHHSKHHQAYVTNLNAALKNYATATSTNDIAGQIALQSAIKFNGGGHINHSLFWENLSPSSSTDSKPESAPTLSAEISKTWGSIQAFQEAFKKTLLGLQGSGWGWLVKDTHGLRIVTTKDQDPVVGGEVPIFGVDMWEHAYYLQYLNGKAAYVDNIWNVINWKTAEARFTGTREDAFKVLRASI